MAFDEARNRMVLFGGAGYRNTDLDVQTFGETWELDGDVWTRVATTGPTPRFMAAMAFDNKRERTVLFGGQCEIDRDFGCCADTWEWDGREWIQATPASAPSERFFSSAAYDPGTETVLLAGGRKCTNDEEDAFERDLWSWDGVAWTKLWPEGQ